MHSRERCAAYGDSSNATWMLCLPSHPLLSNRKGGFNESTESRWKCSLGQENQNLEFSVEGERQAAVKEDWHREALSHQSKCMACSEDVSALAGESTNSQHQRTCNDYASRTLSTREDAQTQRHQTFL